MSENRVKVELVIPVHNRRETTLQALKSLSKIDKKGLEVHIIIVDDGSTDGTSEAILRDFPEIQIIYGDGSLHYAAGTNRGIIAALSKKPDYIVTMNDDAIYHDQFLQRLIKTAELNPHSIIGALLLLWNEPHLVFQIDFKWKTTAGGWKQSDYSTAFDFGNKAFEVEGMAGNCVLFPVQAIEECGLMDEAKFPNGWGDIQYLVRMKKMGWKLLVEPKALVWCEPNTNPNSLHKLKIGEIIQILFKNRRHPANLQRQFIARWESAPNKLKAISGFLFYIWILLKKSIKYKTTNIKKDIEFNNLKTIS